MYKLIMTFEYGASVKNRVRCLKRLGTLKFSSVSTISVRFRANFKIKHVIGSYVLTSNLDRLKEKSCFA
jgi:hypothetical protein